MAEEILSTWSLQSPEVFIRFNGNNKLNRKADKVRIDDWVERLCIWVEKGLEKVYFIVSQHDEADSPALAQYVVEQFNLKLEANIPTTDWKSDDPIVECRYIEGEEISVEITTYKMRIKKDNEEDL